MNRNISPNIQEDFTQEDSSQKCFIEYYLTVLLTLQLWPVLTTLGSVSLHCPGGHHYHLHPPLPHHLPRVLEGPGQRSLHRDERVLLFVSINIVSIDIVCLKIIVISLQYHSGVVITQHICVAILKIDLYQTREINILKLPSLNFLPSSHDQMSPLEDWI